MDWIRGHEIGCGSFATINLAMPSNTSTAQFPPLMAVKSSPAVSSASLKNEKRVLDLLGDCPQIIRCFGESCSVERGDELYNLFLEYASGGSLADRIQSHGGWLPEFEVRRLTRTILEGLRYIHEKGFVHCDVKPRNILVFGDGDAKIADFGLSKKAGKNRAETGEEGKFQLRGSPLYMSPESVNDNEYESPCDIWAVGCAVVEMLTGKPAWNFPMESNIYSLLLKIGIGEELPKIPKYISEEGKDFLGKCLVKDPAKRWTAEMLLNHPFLADSGSSSVPLTPKDEPSTSPRCPFDFEDWASIHSQEVDQKFEEESNCWLDSSCPWSCSPTERLLQLVDNGPVDWVITDSWVTVR
ncbi:mitogen-activated protein kinase kinase kinase 17-like [Cucurbita pepo subsp. pepo]|uniref:mitogen-activated protein kinase kinase kinase 17-like n=1 Tax=Cucurbita pepo subsp. pepo TaxID=3664 RepID=UPI000C9D6F78|nr:mitogen-activated protein kinase kinase kinase 17-like [Cucurbita pepo subsp. pepo]XP_023522778.1 mitogen-activated protein kinase kinase kinase 17-like [Cucurbita pepo subsp. pepo]